MSDKLRSVNTKFWDDPFIEELKDRVDILTKKLESFKDNYGTKN
jgi:hypothetical protein